MRIGKTGCMFSKKLLDSFGATRPRPSGQGVEGLTKKSLNLKKSPFNEEKIYERRQFMKLKIYLLLVFFAAIFSVDCAEARTYSLSLRYQPTKDLGSLQQKLGSTLGIAPFKDERKERSYIGVHTPLQSGITHFESSRSPLEKALQESLIDALSRSGVRVISVPNWDGTPESLKYIDTDSVLMVEIKKFWTEGNASLFRTNIRTMVQLVIHLGVKKEGRVFTRNAEVEKEITVSRSTPQRVEAIINQMISDIFDTFLSSPY
jgi:uncharacterized lipoprotein YajG